MAQHPQPEYAADARVRIGHVHLKVADLERAIAFYGGLLGLEVKQRMGGQAAFLAAGDYHHHIGLNTWESRGGEPPPPWEPPAYTIPRFCTPAAPHWPRRCTGCCRPA